MFGKYGVQVTRKTQIAQKIRCLMDEGRCKRILLTTCRQVLQHSSYRDHTNFIINEGIFGICLDVKEIFTNFATETEGSELWVT